jgi:hypothetical protein
MSIKLVSELGWGCGYEWNTVQLGKDETKFYFRSGAGCSCYTIDDDPWLELKTQADWNTFVEDSTHLGTTEYSDPASAVEFIAQADKLVNSRSLP